MKSHASAQQALAHESGVYKEYLQTATDSSNSHQNSGVTADKAAVALKKALEEKRPALNTLLEQVPKC